MGGLSLEESDWVDDNVNMDHTRPAVASILGVLTVAGLALLWFFVVSTSLVMTVFYVLQSFEPRDGGFIAWVVGLVIWGVLVTFVAAWMMFRRLRSLGESAPHGRPRVRFRRQSRRSSQRCLWWPLQCPSSTGSVRTGAPSVWPGVVCSRFLTPATLRPTSLVSTSHSPERPMP